MYIYVCMFIIDSATVNSNGGSCVDMCFFLGYLSRLGLLSYVRSPCFIKMEHSKEHPLKKYTPLFYFKELKTSILISLYPQQCLLSLKKKSSQHVFFLVDYICIPLTSKVCIDHFYGFRSDPSLFFRVVVH